MVKRSSIWIGLIFSLFFLPAFTLALSPAPICGDGICDGVEKHCSSSAESCEDPTTCVATSDCGPHYCPDDCEMNMQDLDKCRGECKSSCADEECRSKCIKECKHSYGSPLEEGEEIFEEYGDAML